MKKKSFVLLACTPLFTTALPAYSEPKMINNEVNLGLSDLQSVNDNFVGIGYVRYLDSVKIDQQAYSISPYLQRANYLGAAYFGADNNHRTTVYGKAFLNNGWNFSGRLDYYNFRNSDEVTLNADTSYFISENLELGAGIVYQHQNYSFGDKNELWAKVFARYTTFDRNAQSFTPGWDLSASAVVLNKNDYYELNADYYLEKYWSLNIGLFRAANIRSSRTTLEMGTQVWFSKSSSFSFGLGFDAESFDGDLNSLALAYSHRF